MTYTRNQFGKDLKKRILLKQNITEIGHGAYSIYLNNLDNMNDPDFDNIFLTINSMEDGPEFTFTYEELNQIAEDLISDKQVDL